MSLSSRQYAQIMDIYARHRQAGIIAGQKRQEEIYQILPEIRRIDDQIAHISVEKARYMVLHPGEDKKEELHKEILDLSMTKLDLLVTHGYPPDYLDPVYTCPLCRDTGYTDKGRCTCFNRYASEILSEQSNLKDIRKEADFSAFRTDYYSDKPAQNHPVSPLENIKKILSECHKYISVFDKCPGDNLLIYGNAGVGKTFLSICIGGELLDRGKSVIYLSSYQFFHQLEEYTFHREDHSEDTLSELLNCDLLIIDDLGTEMNNAFINSRLFSCINERILRKKSTIINTNLSLKQISRTYSERISSRIIESYRLLHIYGDDIRIKKAVSD